MALTLTPAALVKWRWLPGMVALWPSCKGGEPWLRIRLQEPSGASWSEKDSHVVWALGAVPDLTDPVTSDGLPRIVRDAWGRPGAFAFSREIMPLVWVVEIQPGVQFSAQTELAAWIAALEAAPCQR